MKFSLMIMATFVLGSNVALANSKCQREAEQQARRFSARENQVSISSIRAEDSFFHSETRGVLYYGVRLDNREELNVGLRKSNCSLAEINYVTGGL